MQCEWFIHSETVGFGFRRIRIRFKKENKSHFQSRRVWRQCIWRLPIEFHWCAVLLSSHKISLNIIIKCCKDKNWRTVRTWLRSVFSSAISQLFCHRKCKNVPKELIYILCRPSLSLPPRRPLYAIGAVPFATHFISNFQLFISSSFLWILRGASLHCSLHIFVESQFASISQLIFVLFDLFLQLQRVAGQKNLVKFSRSNFKLKLETKNVQQKTNGMHAHIEKWRRMKHQGAHCDVAIGLSACDYGGTTRQHWRKCNDDYAFI